MSIEMVAIIIIACTIVLYCINKIPVALVSLISVLAMVLFGVLDFKSAFGGFASNSLLMITGMMIIGYALIENGIADLIAKYVFGRFGKKPMPLIIAIFISAAVLSAFLHNITVLVLYFALIDAAVKGATTGEGLLKRKSLYMVAMVGCLIGGNSTLAGSSPPGVANSILESLAGTSLSFFEPAVAGLPTLAVMGLLYWLFFYKLSNKVFYSDGKEDAFEIQSEAVITRPTVAK